MSETYEQGHPSEDTSPEQLLQFSQRLRKQLVNSMTDGGIPGDKEERQMLLRTLADMDQTSIQRVKNDIDQQGVENDRKAQQIVEQLYHANPHGLRSQEPVQRDLPAPPQLPDYETVQGETDIGVSNEDSESFLQRMDHQQNGA